MSRVLLIFVLVFSLSSCAGQVVHNTPSGKVEVCINKHFTAKVLDMLQKEMQAKGYHLYSVKNWDFTFQKGISNGLASFFLKHGITDPVARIIYHVSAGLESTRIIASFAVVNDLGLDSESIKYFNEVSDTQKYQDMLNQFKQTVETMTALELNEVINDEACLLNLGEPIVDGSQIKILLKFPSDSMKVVLTDGMVVPAERILYLRNIVKKLSCNQKEVGERLLNYDIKFLQYDNRYIINYEDGLSTSAYISIKMIDKNVWGIFNLTYSAKDWIFVNHFGVNYDGVRYESPRIRFEKDNNAGEIWETYHDLLAGPYLQLAEAIANSRSCIIRFYGKKGFVDYTMSSESISRMKDALDLIQLIKESV